MRIALIAPSIPVIEHRLEQRMEGLRVRFGQDIEIRRFNASRDAPGDWEGFDCVAAYWEDPASLALPGVTHRVSAIGRVMPLHGAPLAEADDPHANTHPFNKWAPRSHAEIEYGSFRYFPYGYLFGMLGLGPADEFGHRISGNLRVHRDRSPAHKLVAVFGGSAVWGTTVLPHQSFPAQIQDLLSKDGALRDRGHVTTVLNFGIPGATVLNALQKFLLFAVELRPDILIAHDGVNDMFYGYSSDPWLVHQHQIVYQPSVEDWARSLSSNKPEPGTAAAHSKPQVVDLVRAYVRRKREFLSIAKALGASTIAGLQPLSESKAALSSLEGHRIRASWGGTPTYQGQMDLVNAAYTILSREKPDLGASVHVDFHDEFAQYGSGETLFADKVHLDVDGEKKIAERYFPLIKTLLLNAATA